MFKWLKNFGAPSIPVAAQQAHVQPPPPSMKEVFDDTELFTDWVDEYLIKHMPWRKDFDRLPDEEAQRDLNITFEQRERLVKEHSVLRIVGVLVFVHDSFGSERYQRMVNDLAGRLTGALELEEPNAKGTLGQVLDDYSRAAVAEDFKALSTLYMRRVYDDSDYYLRMLHAGVGDTAVIEITGMYEVLRDQYFETVIGHSYETEVLLRDASEKLGNTPG